MWHVGYDRKFSSKWTSATRRMAGTICMTPWSDRFKRTPWPTAFHPMVEPPSPKFVDRARQSKRRIPDTIAAGVELRSAQLLQRRPRSLRRLNISLRYKQVLPGNVNFLVCRDVVGPAASGLAFLADVFGLHLFVHLYFDDPMPPLLIDRDEVRVVFATAFGPENRQVTDLKTDPQTDRRLILKKIGDVSLG